MPHELTVTKERDILHVCARGDRNFQSVLEMAREIMQSCQAQGTWRVLVDASQLEGKLSLLEIFQLVVTGFAMLRDRRVLRKAALVDVRANQERYRFLETVAVNRGYNLRVFTEIDEAIAWLEPSHDGPLAEEGPTADSAFN